MLRASSNLRYNLKGGRAEALKESMADALAEALVFPPRSDSAFRKSESQSQYSEKEDFFLLNVIIF